VNLMVFLNVEFLEVLIILYIIPSTNAPVNYTLQNSAVSFYERSFVEELILKTNPSFINGSTALCWTLACFLVS
jgi:hypothetical protein